MAWTTPHGSKLQYCAKVGIACFVGYLLCLGDRQQYGVYAAFTAALIVGASVGEDLATSGNRVLGTLAGMVAGLAVSAAFGPSVWSLAAGVSLTAFIATGFGWGVPAARIGASLCAVIIAAHVADVLEYSLMRAANTLLGVAVGLLVSVVVLPVRGRHEIARGRASTLAAAAAVLDCTGAEGASKFRMALLNAALALEKTSKDVVRERILKEDVAGLVLQARQAQTVGLCAMAASLAGAELADSARPGGGLPAAPLAEARAMASRTAARVRAFMSGAEPDAGSLTFEALAARLLLDIPQDSPLRLTLLGFLYELRKIEVTLARARPGDPAVG